MKVIPKYNLLRNIKYHLQLNSFCVLCMSTVVLISSSHCMILLPWCRNSLNRKSFPFFSMYEFYVESIGKLLVFFTSVWRIYIDACVIVGRKRKSFVIFSVVYCMVGIHTFKYIRIYVMCNTYLFSSTMLVFNSPQAIYKFLRCWDLKEIYSLL